MGAIPWERVKIYRSGGDPLLPDVVVVLRRKDDLGLDDWKINDRGYMGQVIIEWVAAYRYIQNLPKHISDRVKMVIIE